MQGALSALLASVAGHYAQLSPKDVGIGLTGGRLAVSDVQLRPESLQNPALPFRIVSGRAGTLRVNVPWSALSSSPVTVQLEDVALVAAPRHSQDEAPPPPPPQPPPQDLSEKWHQTRLGRVLFNVSVEISRLAIEYRDPDCIAHIEASALRAHSVDENGDPAFVPLDDTDGAVAMRKLCSIDGLRCIMRPAAGAEMCFENARPLIENVNVTVRALVCAGECVVEDEVIEGLHTELDVELDDPAINISKRQLEWIQFILDDASSPSPAPSMGDRTPRRIRSHNSNLASIQDDMSSDAAATANATAPVPAPAPPAIVAPSSQEVDVDANGDTRSMASFISDDASEYDEEEDSATSQPKRSGLFSFWSAIVEENMDETVDDAAYALGFRHTDSELQRLLDGGAYDDEDDYEDNDDLADSHQGNTILDLQDPKTIVETAVGAGGFTLRVRLRTPDARSWNKVRLLEEELRAERELRAGLEDVENALREADVRVQVAEANADQLGARNNALVGELKELEEMTSKAARNKDEIIRQTEAALQEAKIRIEKLVAEKCRLENNVASGNAHDDRSEQWSRNRRSSTDTFVVNHYSEDEVDDVDESLLPDVDMNHSGTRGLQVQAAAEVQEQARQEEGNHQLTLRSSLSPPATPDAMPDVQAVPRTTPRAAPEPKTILSPLQATTTTALKEVALSPRENSKLNGPIVDGEEWYVSSKVPVKLPPAKSSNVHDSFADEGLTLL